MEFQFNVIVMVEKCIRRVVSIQESIADLEIPPTVQNELKALMKDLIDSKTTAQQEKRIAEENEEDHIKRIARHEKEIFRLDDSIKRLREDVTELQTQQNATQNELVETRTNLTTQLQQTQNELVETRTNLTTQLQQAQNELEETRNNLTTQLQKTQNELVETRNISTRQQSELVELRAAINEIRTMVSHLSHS